jgi:hypothetical protein
VRKHPDDDDATRPPLHRRLFWFVALWAAGVGTVALVAYALRGVLT